jgi:hypothetical protein
VIVILVDTGIGEAFILGCRPKAFDKGVPSAPGDSEKSLSRSLGDKPS